MNLRTLSTKTNIDKLDFLKNSYYSMKDPKKVMQVLIMLKL